MHPYSEQGRRRVMYIAVVAGLFAIITTIWSHVYGNNIIEQFADLLAQFFQISGQQFNVPPVENPVWILVIKIGLSLLVPACGVVGVLQKNRSLICLFSGCSCLSCCLTWFTMVFLFLAFLAVSFFYNSALPDLAMCNPGAVCPPDNGNLQTDNVKSCLARNIWKEYNTTIKYGSNYSTTCQANLYLDCNMTSMTVEAAFEAESASSEAVQVRRLADEAPVFEDLATIMVGGRGDKLGRAPPDMPADPLKQCKVNEVNYRSVTLLIDTFTNSFPNMRSILIALTIFSLFSVVVHCLSAWFGKAYYDVLGVQAFTSQPVVYAVNQEMTQPRRF